MNRLIYIFLVSLFMGNVVNAQTLNAYIEAADSSFLYKDYYSSLKYYEIANEITDFERADLLYKYGESARLIYAYTLADTTYQQVLEKQTPGQFPLVLFWLAETKQKLGQYDAAKNYYERFLAESAIATSGYYKEVAMRGVETSGYALEMIAEAKEMDIQQLSAVVNTPYSEFGAYQKGDTLFYSSFCYVDEEDKHNPPRLYTRRYASINGNSPEVQTTFQQPLTHSSHNAFSSDFKRIYYTLCEYLGNTAEIRCRLYYKDMDEEGRWGAPVLLPEYINMPGYTATEPSVGVDRATGQEFLFFVSDRPESKGKRDIWCSFINENGEISNPFNVADINTIEDDITPFFHTRSQTLYFSSNGRRGLGGFDMFKSKKQGNNWTAPENLKYPLNSSMDDIYYSINRDDDRAHFSSNRKGATYMDAESEMCCHDIYSVELDIFIDLFALTFNKETGEPLTGVTIELYEIDENGERKLITTVTNEEGNDYLFPLEKDKNYLIAARREGFNTIEEPVSTKEEDIEGLERIEKRLYLEPIVVDLTAYVFDSDDRQPLNGATITLYELTASGDKKIEEQLQEESNKFFFPLERDKDYFFTVARRGYESVADTLILSEMEITQTEHFEANIYLTRTGFEDYLPLSIYFDNDIPDRRSRKTTTDIEYSQTFEPYYGKKDEFKQEYVTPISEEEERFLAENRFDIFFDREVKEGYELLLEFTDKLYNFLQRGNAVEIQFSGYASPRAAEAYNYRLSQRRVQSVYNHFESYKGGIFSEIIAQNRLIIGQEAFGEKTASSEISDELQDSRGSIYSVGASVERRVEIVEVKTTRMDDSNVSSSRNVELMNK